MARPAPATRHSRKRNPRKYRRARLVAASAATALAAVAAAGCASSTAATTNNSPGLVLINTSPYKGNIITPVAKPAGTMVADDGKPYNIRTMTKGIVTLLYFGYTHCPNLCPLTMGNTAAAIRMLPKADQSKVIVLFVSVDPTRDTLARLRSWLGSFDPAFIGLRGPLSQVENLESQTGLPDGPEFKDGVGAYQLDHATEMFAFSTDNIATDAFFPSTPAAYITHDLKLLIAGGRPS